MERQWHDYFRKTLQLMLHLAIAFAVIGGCAWGIGRSDSIVRGLCAMSSFEDCISVIILVVFLAYLLLFPDIRKTFLVSIEQLKIPEDSYWGRHPVVCFFCRILVVLAAIFVISLFAIGEIYLFDKFNIVRKTTTVFSLHSRNFRYITFMVFFMILACIPGVPYEIRRLIRRIRSVKDWFTLYSDGESENIEILGEIENESLQESSPKSSQGDKTGTVPLPDKNILTKILKKAQEIRRRKNLIIQMHAGRFHAIAAERNFHLADSSIHFDSCLRRGDDLILVKVVSWLSVPCADTIAGLINLVGKIPKEPEVQFHLIVYGTPSMMAQERKDLAAQMENAISRYERICLFRYSVTDNNAVKPED